MCSTVGGAQYRGGVQYRGGYHEYFGGYHEYCGGYLEYRWVFNTVGDIMINVGGYVEYHGGRSVPWGIS